MHWKSTLILILLAAGAGAWLWKGDDWAVKWGWRPAPEPALADSSSVQFLEQQVLPETLTSIEIPAPNAVDSLTLERPNAQAEWSLPGNWPLRKPVVDELVAALSNLRTRFAPIALPINPDLKPYGLAASQSPLEVKIVAGGSPHTLLFGEPPLASGQTSFTRPTYVRIDDKPEVLRLGPDVLPVIRRPLEDYRKRQVFSEVQRVRLESNRPPDPMGGPPPPPAVAVAPIVGDTVQSVEVVGPDTVVTILGLPIPLHDGRYVLRRSQPNPQPVARTASERLPALGSGQLAAAWEAIAPVKDRVEPDRLRAVVTAMPELWVESFQQPEEKRVLAAQDVAAWLIAGPPFVGLASWAAAPLEGPPDAWFLRRAGLVSPERRIVATGPSGKIELLIGNVATVKTINETGREELRYAMLANNPSIFLIKTDRLGDVFVKSPDLRDPRLARFAVDEVEEVSVARAGQLDAQLTRTKGDPKAATDAEKRDRWYLARDGSPLLADESKVNDLLSMLAGLQSSADRQSFTSAAPSQWKVTLRTREPRPEGQPPGPERTYTFLLEQEPGITILGVPVAKGKNVLASLEGWPRVDRIENADERVSKLVDRPAVAYRSRKLFDTATAKLQSLAVQGAAGESFAMAKSGDTWALTQPPAGSTDSTKAGKLTGDLSELEAVEFLTESPSPTDLAKFKLDKPELTVTLTFTGGASKPQKLEIGGSRDMKSESYARLDGGSVFTIPDTVVDSLRDGALALLPTQVLGPEIGKFTRIDLIRAESKGNESYTLTPAGEKAWQLTGPFTAPVPGASVEPAVSSLSSLAALKYVALAAADPKLYGLDRPELRVGLTFTQGPSAGGKTESRTLLIGKPKADGTARFAQVQGGPNAAVFTLAADVLDRLDRPALELLDTRLLALSTPDIQRVAISGSKPDDSLTLMKANGKWVAEGQDFAVDPFAIQNFLRRLANFRVEKFVGYGGQVKWPEHGLEPAERTITITVEGEKPGTHTIAFGKKDMTGDRYTRVDSGPALAIVFAGNAADLSPGKLDFVDRTLLSFSPASFDGLLRVKGKDELEIEPGTVQGWNIVKPAKQKADMPMLDGLIGSLAQLRAVRIVAHGTRDDLKAFGLDNPAASITLNVLDGMKQRVLKIGNPVDAAKPDGERYAFVEGPGPNFTVGVLPASISKVLLADPIFYHDRTLAAFRDADKLTLERGDRKVTFAKVMGTWRVLEPVRADAEHPDLEEFWNALATLRADELLKEKAGDLAPYGLDKPQVKWKAFNRGKEELSLLVGKTENGRAFAKLEKQDAIAALESKLTDSVLGEYRKRKVWDGVDAAQVDSVVISTGGDRSFQFAKLGPTWVDPRSPTDRVSTPAVNDLLGALAGLTAERYVADENADPKLYGLDKPQRVIVLTQRSPMGGGLTRTLRIGGFEGGSDGKRVYAAVEEPGRTDVFVLSEGDTARVMKDRAAFVAVEKKE